MKRHYANCPAGDINIPFNFTVEGKEGNEKIGELEPKAMRDLLTGPALLAYQRYRLLLLGQVEGAALFQTKAYITHTEDE